MRIAYLDCVSGISGDMLLGALIDAGVDLGILSREVQRLGVGGWSLAAERVSRAGIAATKAHVRLAEAPQPPRRLPDILAMLEESSLSEEDRRRAADVFRRLAEAEAKVHGCTADDVDFHEVGALDAIVDIVGSVIGLRLLGVDRLYCSPLPLGSGRARSQHGWLPVPAPATLALLEAAQAPIARAADDRPMELVTPTGAAIVATLATFDRPAMRLERVGTGAGGRDPDGWPNVLRLWMGETEAQLATREMSLVETNIDDMNGEIVGYVRERLFDVGAVDVWVQPLQMKKGRPGMLLAALCAPARQEEVARVLLQETTTLGVRVTRVSRYEADRETLEFESSLGPAVVKVKRLPGEAPRIAPEYEACRAIALATGMPLLEVYRIVESEARPRLADEGKGSVRP